MQTSGGSVKGTVDYQSTSGGVIPTPSLHTIERATDAEMRLAAREFVNAYHSYIQWADRPSRKLYWLLFEARYLVGVFGLGSAFARPKPVSVYMQEHNLSFNQVGNNIVYALHVQKNHNAGSRFLKLLRYDAKAWWKERYGDDLRAMQTFILPPRTGLSTKLITGYSWDTLQGA